MTSAWLSGTSSKTSAKKHMANRRWLDVKMIMKWADGSPAIYVKALAYVRSEDTLPLVGIRGKVSSKSVGERGGDRVSPRWKPDEQDAGDHKGPPNPSSSTLAPTDHPALWPCFLASVDA